MKKIISMILIVVIGVMAFTGCGQSEVAFSEYSEEALKVIDMANELIEKEYDVKIENDDYSFSVGKQINDTDFVDLYSEEKAEEGYENIVSVSSLLKNEPKEGQVISYSVTFNRKTLEVIENSIDK